MGFKMISKPDWAELQQLTSGVVDHFAEYTSGQRWTTTASDLGTVVLQDKAHGVILISPSDGTVADNDETYVHTTKEIFKFVAGSMLWAKARIIFAEANVDDANLWIGFMDAVAANALIDNGGGPKASFSGAGFYKIDGELQYHVITSVGTVRQDTKLNAAGAYDRLERVAGSASPQYLEIECYITSATKMDVVYRHNGERVAFHEGVDITSATEMQFAFGVKNGGATQDLLEVDAVAALQFVESQP